MMIGTNAKTPFTFPYFFSLARCIVMTKLSKLMICLLVIIGLMHFTMHYFIQSPESIALRHTDLNKEDTKSSVKHIEELEKIKRSAASELRELESRIHNLQKEVTGLQSQSIASEKETKRAQSDLESLKRQILQAKNERLEMMHQNPRLPPPVRLLPSEEDNIDLPPTTHSDWCRMYNCFDYSRCSITSQFPVYVYPPSNVGNMVWPVTPYILDASINAILGNPYITSDPTVACLYIVIMGEAERDATMDRKDPDAVQLWLSSLPYWRGDGRNHVIVHMARQATNQNLLLGVDTGRAIIAQSSYKRPQFRDGFDIVLPSLISTIERTFISKRSYADSKDMGADDPGNIIPQVPVSRQYFLTFTGRRTEQTALDTIKTDEREQKDFVGVKSYSALLDALKEMSSEAKHGKMHFEVSCKTEEMATKGYESEWDLCGSTESRLKLLADSTFSLILAPDDHTLLSTTLLTTRLAESLHSGAIPVILGTQVVLPFNEHIDWTKAAILFPKPRITELAFFLSSFPHSDIAALRRRGKFLYDTYFASPKAIIDAILATLRTRINIPPQPIQDEISTVFEHRSYAFDKEVAPGDAQSEFALPAFEGKIDSPKFIRNFTSITIDAKDLWNKAPGPFQLHPSTPYDRVLPSDAKFVGSSEGFKPIGEGYGGVGAVFQQSLGGNVPREQFTIVMLTYEREEVMLQSLQRLKGLPYLNKVILVWNSPNTPPDDLQWPDIEVEVVVVRPKRNSLNNRFLPFNEIETDAVLSIDDDAHLRHDEILFSFRVWREQRDCIVGFPGRYHAWDLAEGRWKYNSEYCCELSMVLTGAAFFHKYYMHMYSYWMPQEIRDKVDELMNCEDIAMNFLVSHLTRAPPVKVTSRWTFRCPGCPEALSQSQSHFDERHVCINYFVKVYGYMPLLGTQFRVDSILFKTRLPHDKQKCFKFI